MENALADAVTDDADGGADSDSEKGCFTGRRILVAEDNEANRYIMEYMLRAEGARVRMARDGKAALAADPIKARAHITGGGLLENIPRVLPEGTAAHLKKGSWPQTELFAWLQKTAGIDDIEMNRTFNNGIGMVVVVDAANAEATAATLRAAGEQVYTIGTIAQRGEGAAVVVA